MTRLAELIGAADISPWPRDEWMIGDARSPDGRYREYIAHLQPPRFVARIVGTDDDGKPEAAELPADLLSVVVYTSEDSALCEIEWIDEIMPGEIVKWLEAAADEIERRSAE